MDDLKNELEKEFKERLIVLLDACKNMNNQEIIEITNNILKEENDYTEEEKKNNKELIKTFLEIRNRN